MTALTITNISGIIAERFNRRPAFGNYAQLCALHEASRAGGFVCDNERYYRLAARHGCELGKDGALMAQWNRTSPLLDILSGRPPPPRETRLDDHIIRVTRGLERWSTHWLTRKPEFYVRRRARKAAR